MSFGKTVVDAAMNNTIVATGLFWRSRIAGFPFFIAPVRYLIHLDIVPLCFVLLFPYVTLVVWQLRILNMQVPNHTP